jgi:O-antigen/teichoic acid export membrane protein
MSGPSNPITQANAFWHRFLPSFLRSRLDGRHGLQAILGNSSWLMADKLIRMGMGVVVGIWVTRYLGPGEFGQLAYSWAFAGLFGAIATLGLDGIVIRELLQTPEARDRILGTAFSLKLAGGLTAMAASLIGVAWLRPGDGATFALMVVASLNYVFLAVNVIDFYFQSRVQSRYTVICAMAAFVLMTVLRITLVLLKAPLIWFALAAMGDSVIASLFLLVPYARQHLNALRWTFDGTIAKRLLHQSWPLILSNLAILVYMRVDQIMIGQMLNETEVGLFAASVKLTEIWYFVPGALLSSVFPALVAAKQMDQALFERRMQQMYDAMCWLGIGVGVAATLLAHWAVPLLYGPAFARTADVLTIQVWAGVAVAMGCVNGNWLLIEGLQKYSLVYALFALVVNVGFNLLLIPTMGIQGAAIATLLGQFSPNLLQLFLPKARGNLWQMFKALGAPIRLLRAQGALARA